MRKSNKLLGALLVGASLLGSQVANAAVTEVTEVNALETTDGILVKFLSSTATLDYTLFYKAGDSYTTSKSDNVTVSTLGSVFLNFATVTFGTGALSDGSYGWLKFTPSTDGKLAISWSGTNVSVSAVPEPGVYALIGLGVAGLALARRRQKKSAALGRFAV